MEQQQKLAAEVAVELITKAIKGTKIVQNEGNTGYSFFQGKKRLGKVLKSKKGLALEINVVLPKEVEKQFLLEMIPMEVAHKKHLGTMKYMARAIDPKELPILIKAMVDAFKEEVAKEQEGPAPAPVQEAK